jgi:hypothetical protein
MTITLSGTGVTFSDGKQTTAYRSSNGANGWARLSDGTLIQWGQSSTYSLSANGGARAALTITYPVAFTTVYRVIATNDTSSVPGGSLWYPIMTCASSITTSNFVWYCGEPNNGCIGATLSTRWIAFGI